MLVKPFAAAAAALTLLGAAPMRAADPLKLMNYLVGTWNCVSKTGSRTQTYTARYEYANGGTWLRTTNSSKGFSSEDMMTYENHRWIVIDMEPARQWSMLSAPDTGLAHIAFITEYPKPGLHVTFDRRSPSRYTLTFSGTLNGKRASWVDVCSKADM